VNEEKLSSDSHSFELPPSSKVKPLQRKILTPVISSLQLSQSDICQDLVREGESMYKTILSLMKSYKRNSVDLNSKKVALVHFFESERLKFEYLLS
jgi:hypothetical protein